MPCRRHRTARRCRVCWRSTLTTTASKAQPRIVRTDSRMDFRWTLNSPGRGIPFDWYSVRWTGSLTAPRIRRQAHRHRGKRRLPPLPRRTSRHRQLEKAVVRHRASTAIDLSARFVASTFVSSISRAPATRRLKLMWDAGVVDDSRRTDRRGGCPRERRATRRSSSPGWRRESSAIARCWRCPGRQEELIRSDCSHGQTRSSSCSSAAAR